MIGFYRLPGRFKQKNSGNSLPFPTKAIKPHTSSCSTKYFTQRHCRKSSCVLLYINDSGADGRRVLMEWMQDMVLCTVGMMKRDSFARFISLSILRSISRNSTFFSKLDLSSILHQIRFSKHDIKRSFFKANYGLFEFLVMSTNLRKRPAAFRDLTKSIFYDYIDYFSLSIWMIF